MKFVMLRYPHWRCQLIKPQKIETLDKLSSDISLELNKVLLEHSPTRNIKGTPTNHVKEITEKRSITCASNSSNGSSYLSLDFSWKFSNERWSDCSSLWTGVEDINNYDSSFHTEDPHLYCEEYEEGKTYGACVRQELKGIFKKALNCTPPLLVEEPDEHDDFCSQRFNVTEQERNRILRDLYESHFNLFKPSSCKNPSTRTTYEV